MLYLVTESITPDVQGSQMQMPKSYLIANQIYRLSSVPVF